MTVAAFLAYCAAITFAAATPGPSMFAVITTGVSRGFASAFMVGVGVAIADGILVVTALAGLVALVQTFEWIFLVLKYAGAAYLVWLGIRMWRARASFGGEGVVARAGFLRSFLLGGSIGLGNPKAILFHAAIMPLILDLQALSPVDCMIVVAAILSANTLVMGVYAGLSGWASRWFRTEGRVRWMNRVAGSAMIGTGALIASR